MVFSSFFSNHAQTVSTRPPVVAAAIAAGKGAAPMFVQFVMEPLCAVYREILVEQNLPKMQKMIERLELKYVRSKDRVQ